MIFSKILTFFLLIHKIHCSRTDLLVSDHPDLMFLMTIIWLTCMIRLILINLNIPCPCHLFMVLIGMAFGIAVYNNESAAAATKIIHVHPHELLYVYFPTLIFSVAFCMDVPIFLKSLPQIFVMSIGVSFLTSFVYGCLMRLIVENETYGLIKGFIYGVFSSPVYPSTIIYLLKKQSIRTKQISILLEGEAIISLITADILASLYVPVVKQFMVRPHQYIMVLIRFIVGDLIIGFLTGWLCRYLIRKMYTDRISVFVLVFAVPFCVYSVTKKFVSGCGGLAVAVVGAILAEERAVLSKDIERFLIDFWTMISLTVDIVVATLVSTYYTSHIAPDMSLPDKAITGLVAYMLYYLIRFISCLVFSPALSRLGYGMDLKNMLVIVWSGIKCPYSLVVCRFVINLGVKTHVAVLFYHHMMYLYFISLLINGSFTRVVLDFLGLRQISLARQINMNNSVKRIFLKRNRSIAVLKMDRFLCDTNWLKVFEATNMKHPYRIDSSLKDTDEFFAGYHYSICPDCKNELPHEPTNKEFKEMRKEAKLRTLKAKKMSYSRQFENGMMSKEGIRILSQAIELAMDSEDNVIELKGLQKKFTEEGFFQRFVRHRVREIKVSYKVSAHRPPRKHLRRLCYYIVFNRTWRTFKMSIVMFHVIVLILDMIEHPSLWVNIFERYDPKKWLDWVLVVAEASCSWLYALECPMKILGYSWSSIWNEGCPMYFKSFWNVTDFIAMIGCNLNTVYVILNITSGGGALVFRQFVDVLRLVRPIRLLQLFEIFYPKLMKYLDRNVDLNMAFTYELGKSYAVGETEILNVLPYMIDNKKIRKELRNKSEADRLLIKKLLGVVQKEKPWVAITVKSKQAIRTVLKNMNDAIKDLKNSGWVDDFELKTLRTGMNQLYKNVNAIKSVEPSAPKVVFREVAWMNEEKNVIDFLFENVTVKKFEPGDIVFGEGTVADGIYIVVTGLLMVTYNPDKNVVNSLKEYGRLPVVDFFSGSNYGESTVDYIVSGNCVGELSTLTGRSYNCVITADAHSQVYVLSTGVLERAKELSPDPVIGLECRIWKEVGVRMAIPILCSVRQYQSLSQDQIKYALERAFVPDLSNYKIFVVTEMIQDILLLDGTINDYNSRESFIAPCCIPRTVQKIVLPKSSLMNVTVEIQPKLLLIPEKDVDEYDVMIAAEETCEMVSTGASAKCLQHSVQYKAKLIKRAQSKALKIATSEQFKKMKKEVHLDENVEPVEGKESGVTYFQSDMAEGSSHLMITSGERLDQNKK